MTGRPFPTLELVGLAVIAALAVWLFIRARKRNAPVLTALSGAFNLLANLIVTAFILAHLIAVTKNAIIGKGHGGATSFVYDFSFYSLILVGMAILIPSVVCLRYSWRLALAWQPAWGRVFLSTLILLAINIPLAPLQGFATGFSVILALNGVLLLGCRKRVTG